MEVKEGYKVKVEYTGKFDNGEVFDSSKEHGRPLEFQVGARMVIPGFEKAVLGMKEGDSKEITIKPEEGYGQRNDKLVQKIPRDQLPKDREPKKGMGLMMTTPQGMQVPVTITEVTDTDVTLDLNHPLAGKTLHFEIKILGVEEAELSKECSGGGCGSGSCEDKKPEEKCGGGQC